MSNDNVLMQELGKLQASIDQKFDSSVKLAEEGQKASAGLRADLDKMSQDFAALKAESEFEILSLKQAREQGLSQRQAAKSLGSQFVESQGFADFKAGKTGKAIAHFQNNTIIGEGGSPQNPTDDIVPKDYMPGIIGGAFRNLRVLDAVMKGSTGSNTIHYTRELAWTNAAAETAEGGSKPQSTLTFEGVDEPVRTIPHFLKASKQVLDDAPFLSSYIDARMSHGVRQRIETQIMQGNGTSPNLSGLSTTGNHADLTIVSGDSDFDAANRAKQQVEVSDYEASAFLINPADWGRLERTKTGITNDNTYLGGTGGAVGYINNGMQPTLWGLPVIKSNSVPSGSFFCLSMQALMYVERMGVTVEMFEQDDTNVQSNLVTIRGEARGALAIFRPAAIIYGAWPNA